MAGGFLSRLDVIECQELLKLHLKRIIEASPGMQKGVDVRGGPPPGDDGDRVAAALAQDVAAALLDGHRKQAVEILAAQQRIDEDRYGFCAECEEPIGMKRLRAIPTAQYCVECQEKQELSGRRNRQSRVSTRGGEPTVKRDPGSLPPRPAIRR